MATQMLKRHIGLFALTLYGLGNILGAGIYVLLGKVAGTSGNNTALAFVVAMIIATLTALSYMELSARYPVSASVSVYLYKAFGVKWLSITAGFIMIASSITSAGALAQGFSGYLGEYFSIVPTIASIGLLVTIAILAIIGIGESVIAAAILTVFELLGLLLVIWVGKSTIISFNIQNLFILDSNVGLIGLLSGAFLAFYAFIGFEDIVNVSEEVKNVKKTMPLAILFSLIITIILYILIAIVSLSSLSAEQLNASNASLSLVYETNGGKFPELLGAIGMIASVNGVIVQMIMGSRFLYGLAKQGLINKNIGKVNNLTNTPIIATILIASLMILSVLFLPLTTLAKITSFLILAIFALVNASLIVIKNKTKIQKTISIPLIIPVLGLFCCLGLIIFQVFIWL